MKCLQSLQVLFTGERALLLRHEHGLLAEVRHDALPIPLIELDNFCQRVHGGIGTEPRQVVVQVGLELVQEHLKLCLAELSSRNDVGWIDDLSPQPRHVLDPGLHDLVHPVIAAEEIARNADPGSLQPI